VMPLGKNRKVFFSFFGHFSARHDSKSPQQCHDCARVVTTDFYKRDGTFAAVRAVRELYA